jgi:DNA polymerase-3 subunit alpha
VKFDFLGLRTLTIIDWRAARFAQRRDRRAPLDIDALPLDDAATFELLKHRQHDRGVPARIARHEGPDPRCSPTCFEDIIALVALFRPGPLQSGMVDDFIARKHGRRGAIDYLHPALEPVLKPTYGVILYQEQVMQIAQVLAGYTLGGADLLRRAMGKKKPEEMAKQRDRSSFRARRRGVEARRPTHIFDLMEKFAGYGFNKSHSAAYALVAYQTAWLKAHYPAAFMAAVLSADMDDTDKVVTLIDDARTSSSSSRPRCTRAPTTTASNRGCASSPSTSTTSRPSAGSGRARCGSRATAAPTRSGCSNCSRRFATASARSSSSIATTAWAACSCSPRTGASSPTRR